MKKQTFIAASGTLILSAAAAKLMGALFRVPLANMLGGEGMGYFSSAYGVFMTVYAVSVTGLPAAVAKLTAESSAEERFANIRKIKRGALLLFSVTGLAFTLLMLAAAYPFCIITGNAPAAPSVLAIAPSVFFGCVTAVYRGYFEGLRNMSPTAVSQIIEGIAKLVCGLALCVIVLKNPDIFMPLCLRLGYSSAMPLAAAAAVLGISLSAAAGTAFLIIRYRLRGDGISQAQITASEGFTDSGREIVSALLKTALPVAAGALVTNLTSLIDLVTIPRLLERAAAASPEYFSRIAETVPREQLPGFLFGSFTGLAVTVFNLVPSFTNMFGKGILPAVSEANAASDAARVREHTEKALFATALAAFPSGIGISLLSGGILRVLFPWKPVETSVCAASLSVLGIGVAFLCLSSSAFAVMQALGRPELPVKLMLVGVAVKLAGNLLLVPVPELNISGAALATLLCYAVICIPSVNVMLKLTGCNKKRAAAFLCKVFFCAVLCGEAALLSEKIFRIVLGDFFALVVSIISGVIFYIISTFLLGIFTKSTLNLLIS